MFILFFFCFYWNHLREEKSHSVQVLRQQIGGDGGVKACADNAEAGGGVQNLGNLADVILEYSLNSIFLLLIYSCNFCKASYIIDDHFL